MKRKTRRRQRRTKGGATRRNIIKQRTLGRNIAQDAAQLAEKVVLSWKRQMGLA